MIWEIVSNTHTLKYVVPHLDTPICASVIWTTNGIDSYMLVTSSVDGGLRVWNCNSDGLHFVIELNGPDAEPVISIFPTSKTAFITLDKSGGAFEWKRKLKSNSWKGKRRYSLVDTIIGDVFFSKIYNQGFVLTSKGLKAFEASSGKSIENHISYETVDQIYVDNEGLFLFYIVFYDNIGTLKCYGLKDKSTKLISLDIGTDGIASMAFHSRLGLLASVSECGSLRFFKVFDPKPKSKHFVPESTYNSKDISNMDRILNDLHSYICGDSDVPLNRFPVENFDRQEEESDSTFIVANEEEDKHDDRTFSVSSKEDGRTYSISRSSQNSDS